MTALDTVVNKCASALLDDPLVIPESSGYAKRWKAVYAIFADQDSHPFLYTAFGYAVESYTNFLIKKGALDAYLPSNCSIVLQGGRGVTRPDVVVKQDDKDIGWFDITASDSALHINQKSGSGWTRLGYVAEVLYPSLDPTQLGRKNRTPAESAKINVAVKAEKKARLKVATKLDKAFKKWSDDVIGDSKANRLMVEKRLSKFLGFDPETEKLWPTTVKSIMDYVKANEGGSYHGVFGYKGPYAKGRNKEQADKLLYELETLAMSYKE